MKRPEYALTILRERLRFASNACPYCESATPRKVGTKHLLLTLYECTACGLKYRYPKDDPTAARHYYERSYAEETVVDVPNDLELRTMIEMGFRGSKFDKSQKVAVISRFVGLDDPILDYGASFGYMLQQLKSAGFRHLAGYEISSSRAEVAREKVGVDVASDIGLIRAHPTAPFACLYSSHVIEHLPRLRVALDLFHDLVAPDGLVLLWTPNATTEALERFHGGSWAELVGEPHTMAIDYDFLANVLPLHGFTIVETGGRGDPELFLAARRA